jgi:hypothetical protein
MRRMIFIAVVSAAWLDGHAQSSERKCPNSPADAFVQTLDWTNCYGELTLPNARYKGEWKDGAANGFGTFTSSDGSKYVGIHREFGRFGEGALISPKGHTIVTGEWQDNDTVETVGGSWRVVSDAPDMATLFVLPASVKKDGAFRRAWAMWAYHAPHPVYRWLSSRELIKFDCADERYQRVAATTFAGSFGSGDVLDSFDEGKWEYSAPGSVMSAILNYVCEHKLTTNK